MSNREIILERIKTALGTLAGISTVKRNDVEFSDSEMPAAAILEGDEQAMESTFGRGRPPRGPNIIFMTCQVALFAQTKPEDLGQTLNTLRDEVINLLQTDSILLSYSHNDDIRYEGMTTALAAGREMAGQFYLNFTIAFVQS